MSTTVTSRLLLALIILVLSLFSVSAVANGDTIFEGEEAKSEAPKEQAKEEIPVEEARKSPEILSDVAPNKDFADGLRESEELNSKVKAVDRITEESIIKKYAKKDALDEIPKSVIPSHAICSSGRTEFVVSDSFDCQEAFTSEKQVNLRTNRGKHFAAIELSLDIRDVKKPLIVLFHEQEFDTQDVSIFYLEKESGVWKSLCHNLKDEKNECVITSDILSDELDLRVEGYSREGPALWSVSDILVREEQFEGFKTEESEETSNERLLLFADGDLRLSDVFQAPVIVVTSPAPTPLINPNSGFAGFSYGGFESSGSSDGFDDFVPENSDESAVNVNIGNTNVLPEQEGFLAITGQAIADLATKNVPGLLLTLGLLGLLGYKGYQVASKNARRRRALRRLQ